MFNYDVLYLFQKKRNYENESKSNWIVIQVIMSSMQKSTCRIVNDWPLGIPYHLFKHVLQHVAVACWAIKTGWFLKGVCLPSFFGLAGDNRTSINSLACKDITAIPFFLIYK